MSEWDDLADWWSEELTDPAYTFDVQPLVDKMLAGLSGPSLDLGCGTGRLRDSLPVPAYGCDSSRKLLAIAAELGMPVVQTRLAELPWRDGVIATAVACLVLEHLPDLRTFFSEVARVVTSGGHLVVVSNHPAYTSQGSGPVVDMSDGEVLWRWGSYLFESVATEPAGEGSMVFHHRPLPVILNAAAEAGWSLERMLEAGVSAETVARIPALAGQEHMPRLIALRWRR